MKWYNLKKYKPTDDSYRVFILKSDGHSDVAFVMDGKFISCDEEENISDTVTHFCIPDPIEIDN